MGKKLEKFRDQISQTYLDKQYSDVVFVVKDQVFPAHKIILCSRCPYFQKMFSSIFSILFPLTKIFKKRRNERIVRGGNRDKRL